MVSVGGQGNLSAQSLQRWPPTISANAKGSYRVNSHQSAFILEETKILIPVGSRELFCFYQLHVA